MPRTFLTDEQVRQIRKRVAEGHSTYEVAKEFEVSQSQISRIIRGVSRTDVVDEGN